MRVSEQMLSNGLFLLNATVNEISHCRILQDLLHPARGALLLQTILNRKGCLNRYADPNWFSDTNHTKWRVTREHFAQTVLSDAQREARKHTGRMDICVMYENELVLVIEYKVYAKNTDNKGKERSDRCVLCMGTKLPAAAPEKE